MNIGLMQRVLTAVGLIHPFLSITAESNHFSSQISKRLGVSSLLGATLTGEERFSVAAEIYNCTKF